MEGKADEAKQFLYDVETQKIGFVQHPAIEWMGTSPDALVGDDGMAEYKCPYSQKLPDSPPPHYEAQCLFHLMVTEREWCDLFFWTPSKTTIFRIVRDPEWEAKNLPILESFHEHYLRELDNPDHLEALVQERTDDDYINAAILYRKAKDALAVSQNVEKEARAVLLKLVDKNCSGAGVKVTQYTRQGNVNYKSVPELKGIDLDDYRGKSTTQYRITTKEE